MSFAEIYNKLDKKRWINKWDEREPSENEKDDIKPESSNIKQSEDFQDSVKLKLSNIKPELFDIKEPQEDIKPELFAIQQPEDLQEESEPELSDIEQLKETLDELSEEPEPELSDIKQSEESEKTLDEFCASLFPKSDKPGLKKESEFEIEIDFEELDALLA